MEGRIGSKGRRNVHREGRERLPEVVRDRAHELSGDRKLRDSSDVRTGQI